MNCCELIPAHVRAIAPYQPGKPISELARELGLNEADIVKLASNENPLGPSPLALAAAQDALFDMALYPDGAGFSLKAKLAAQWVLYTVLANSLKLLHPFMPFVTEAIWDNLGEKNPLITSTWPE